MPPVDSFVLGVDLDGVCAEFYETLRPLAAEWLGRPLDELTTEVSYGLPEWGITSDSYPKLHRWAVTQRSLFKVLTPIPGAAPALRRMSDQGVRIRIITHRLFITHFHAAAISQTVSWLDWNGIPYWDLCFMADKGAVGANLYVEDTPTNVVTLRAAGNEVVVFTNSTNREVDGPRADTWEQVEALVRERTKDLTLMVAPTEEATEGAAPPL